MRTQTHFFKCLIARWPAPALHSPSSATAMLNTAERGCFMSICFIYLQSKKTAASPLARAGCAHVLCDEAGTSALRVPLAAELVVDLLVPV